MAKDWETSFLNEINEILLKGGYETELMDIDGEPMVNVIMDSPIDGDDTIGLQIMFDHVGETGTQINIQLIMFDSLSDEMLAECEKVVGRFNEFTVVGNIAVSYAARYVFYNYAFCVFPEMQIATVATILSQTLDIATATTLEAARILSPLIRGNTTAENIINEDNYIIQ